MSRLGLGFSATGTSNIAGSATCWTDALGVDRIQQNIRIHNNMKYQHLREQLQIELVLAAIEGGATAAAAATAVPQISPDSARQGKLVIYCVENPGGH